MAALTEAEARVRSELLDVGSYDVFLGLSSEPVRSRCEIRFGCREPGAATFADLTTRTVLSAVLNGRELGQPVDGRLSLPRLAVDNVLTACAPRGLPRPSASGAGGHWPALTAWLDLPGSATSRGKPSSGTSGRGPGRYVQALM